MPANVTLPLADQPALIRPQYDPAGIALPAWLVYQPGPNGQRYAIARFLSEAAALAFVRQIERGTP